MTMKMKFFEPTKVSIDDFLKLAGWDVDDITTIYYGKDHACRCGCCGTYCDDVSKGFKLRIAKLQKGVLVEGEVVAEDNHINIPLAYTDDKCYCLYND